MAAWFWDSSTFEGLISVSFEMLFIAYRKTLLVLGERRAAYPCLRVQRPTKWMDLGKLPRDLSERQEKNWAPKPMNAGTFPASGKVDAGLVPTPDLIDEESIGAISASQRQRYELTN